MENQGSFGIVYKGNYNYNQEGMITTGHGGWAAGRRAPGDRGGGNAGLWLVDTEKGEDAFGGEESYHITVVELSTEGLTVSSIRPGLMSDSSVDDKIVQFRRTIDSETWEVYDLSETIWHPY